MAYGNYGSRQYGNGGYNRSGYQNQGGYQNQQTAPAPAPKEPIDIHQEIVSRFTLYQQFKEVATNELGITPDEFLMMAPMLGGWVTSILLKQEKGK